MIEYETSGLGFRVKYRNNDMISGSLSNPETAGPAANSFMDISGKRISFNRGVKVDFKFSGVGV